MNKSKLINELTITDIVSTAHPIQAVPVEHCQLATIVAPSFKQPSWFVAYLDYRVVIGNYTPPASWAFYREEPDEELQPQYVQRLRVFNQDEELLLWRSGREIRGRFRTDATGTPCEVVEAKQVLFGTRIDPEFTAAGFTKITEARGTSLILPFQKVQVDEQEQRIFIKTRNYIGYNDVQQATYVDCRFVDFVDHIGKSFGQGGQA